MKPVDGTTDNTMDRAPELHVDLEPLAFLLGTWVGVGVGGYPTIEGDFRFGQELSFSHNGKPFLAHRSRSWILDDDGNRVRPAAQESGYWRPRPEGRVEVVLAHPTGFVEIWLGEVTDNKIEIATDVVARTSSAKEYSGGRRIYGLVQGELLYAYDMAAMGTELTSHLSARLTRVPG